MANSKHFDYIKGSGEQISKIDVDNDSKRNEVLENDLEINLAFQFIFSAILYADKSEAIFSEKINQFDLDSNFLTITHVNNYKNTFPVAKSINKQKINDIREDVYNEVSKNLSDKKLINLEKDKILTLTVPTGGGKTITSLMAAAKINEITNKKSKIIYCMPFTTLIEQNQNVFSKVLDHNGFNSNMSENLLPHYYLSETSFHIKEDEDYDYGKSEHLIETWNSKLIITTFIQLINTFFKNKNRNLKRFIQLANSIIIMDEIQSFPVEYRKLFSIMIKSLSRIFNIHFIFMSATMPYIFDDGDYKEILKKPEIYFKQINRTSLNFIPEDIYIEDIIENSSFIDKYKLTVTSFLFVANTIKSSIKIYRYFEKYLSKTHKLVYMSTNIVPAVRKERVNKIKQHLNDGEMICAVTTQLIEAGVDIDFPLVLRDMGQLDSINQVGGRCNRNGFDEEYPYYIFNLVDKTVSGKDYKTKNVYDTKLVNITREILLEEKCLVKEKNFFSVANRFFHRVSNEKAQEWKKNYLSLCKLNFDSVKVDLIRKNFATAEVFVQINKYAMDIWNEYEEKVMNFQINNKDDLAKKRENYAKIKKKFNSYIISIPIKLAKNLCPVYPDSNFMIIYKDDLENYYDNITGLIRDDVLGGFSVF